jgi:hypothetical protein
MNTAVLERGTAMMWLIDAGDGLDRSRDLLAEAERERFLRSVRASAPRAVTGRRLQVRQRVGLALIRRGEELAGNGAGPLTRVS